MIQMQQKGDVLAILEGLAKAECILESNTYSNRPGIEDTEGTF